MEIHYYKNKFHIESFSSYCFINLDVAARIPSFWVCVGYISQDSVLRMALRDEMRSSNTHGCMALMMYASWTYG